MVSKPDMVDLSVVIVNWNSKKFLTDCIAAVVAGVGTLSFEIVVIDSGSYDGCESVLNLEDPNLTFIQSAVNLGFAGANNAALSVCEASTILFLNPDTKVIGTAIEEMHKKLWSLPLAGLVGARLLNGDGTVQTTCIRAFPTVLNQVLESEVLRRWFPRSRLWGTAALFDWNSVASEVDALSGACVMVKRSVFESIGRFSTDYFMYSEDIDLCYKAAKFGWKSYYVPKATVIHYGGGSTSGSEVSSLSAVMMLESRWRYFIKTRSLGYACVYRAAMCVSSSVRIAVMGPLWPLSVLVNRRSRVEAMLRRWKTRLRWALGLDEWSKRYPAPTK
jgi:N-acetylglucosaminyl-diphospho-decaprenol L-rhamnosyltransferase